jgi:ABC-2 type transport system ATP-binding protein
MIVVDHVTKYYGATPAVRDLDFKIEQGECVGFLGLNGAGKTTTLRLLSCLLLPTSGRVVIRGLDAEEQPHEIRKFIGFLPDTPPLYDEMTVSQYIRFAGRLRRMAKSAVERRLPEVIDICSLGEVADQTVATLSHGYRQRVGIAQAIVHKPALLILDEPIQGLDPVQIVEMREMIRGLRGEHTILLSTHILSEIEQTCDRILMLHEGRIAAQGTEAELAARFGGGVGIELEVRGDEAAVRGALEALEGVDEVQVRASADGVLQITVRATGDVREAASRAVMQAGAGLLGLKRVATRLERIFVDLSAGGTGVRPRPSKEDKAA